MARVGIQLQHNVRKWGRWRWWTTGDGGVLLPAADIGKGLGRVAIKSRNKFIPRVALGKVLLNADPSDGMA